jgi:DNA-binding FadR family transcriptional regulator
MKQYGVSITVIRNAIRELGIESLVRTHQGKGVFVSDPLPEVKQVDSGSQPMGKDERIDKLGDEVTGLRETVALLQAQLINLYEITGHAYPPETIPAGWQARAAEG